MKNIFVSDYSLRELSEKGSLLFREKTLIASAIDNYGADAIELPAIHNLKEDKIIFKTVSSVVQNSMVSIPVGVEEEAVADVFDCIKNAKNPCLQVELPISTVTMEYMYHLKSEKMLKKIASLCKKCSEICENVEFVALDATRATTEFLVEAINTACENGAKFATVCDDAGIATPKDFENIIKVVKESCNIPVYVKVSNALNMANATALYAILAGADGVKTAFKGEKVLKTAEFAEVLESQKNISNITTNLKTTELKSDISQLIKSVKQRRSEQNEKSYDADILLDNECTLSDVKEASMKLGYDLSDKDTGKIQKSLMSVLEKKPNVGAKEFEAIIASVALEVPSTYHLESYNISINNVSVSMASIVLKKEEETISGIAMGDGPIDSAFLAIEQCIGHHYELDAFEIQAVTEGKEALGSAVVRLRFDGKLYSGTGLSADIVGASIRAYINALNKIVFEEGLA